MENTRNSLSTSSNPSSYPSLSDQGTSENLLFIVLDCFSYIAGEKITGEILLNIVEAIPKGQIKFLSRGIEEVQVFDPVERTKVIVEEVNEVFSLDQVFKTWTEPLAPGQYVFPFNVKLPAFCPSTFYFSGEDTRGNYLKAEVLYHVNAKLISHNEEPLLSHSRVVVVKNRKILENPSPCISCTCMVPGCCFTNKGSTDLKLSILNSDHCEVNGKVHFKLDPDNAKCRVPINHVIGSICLDFTLTTKKGSFKIKKIVSSIARATWISAHTSLVYEKDFEYSTDLKVVSGELNPSSNETPLISCEHFIEICVFYDVACMSRPVSIYLPFHVNPKMCFKKEQPLLPEVWNPVESAILSFVPDEREFVSEKMLDLSPININ